MAKQSKKQVSCQIWKCTDDLIVKAQAEHKKSTGVEASKVSMIDQLIGLGIRMATRKKVRQK